MIRCVDADCIYFSVPSATSALHRLDVANIQLRGFGFGQRQAGPASDRPRQLKAQSNSLLGVLDAWQELAGGEPGFLGKLRGDSFSQMARSMLTNRLEEVRSGGSDDERRDASMFWTIAARHAEALEMGICFRC